MRTPVRLFAAAAAIALFTTAAHAQARTSAPASPNQRGTIELGLDGRLAFGLDDPSSTSIQLPVALFRIGFFRNPNWSIEPFFGLDYFDQDNASQTLMNLGVGALYHFQQSRADNQWYVRPYLGLVHVGTSVTNNNVTISTNSNQFELGGGVGFKMPMTSQLGWRFEANLTHLFEGGGRGSQTALGFQAGVSYYTR
jgi:Outer membrane protein beta-barrel domain